MSNISGFIKALNSNFKGQDSCYFWKVLIVHLDGSEEWVKKEGEEINDYEVLDKLMNRDFIDIVVVPV
jgi:hypothetical protein